MMEKVFVLALAAVLVAGFVGAVSISDLNPTMQQSPAVKDSDASKRTVLSELNFLSFFQTEQVTYAPGEEATFLFEVDTDDDVPDTATAYLVYELNRCVEGVARSSLTRDDCNNNVIAHRVMEISGDRINGGESWGGSALVDMPDSEGNYEAVAYIWYNDPVQGATLASDAPNTFVTVETPETDSGDTGTGDTGDTGTGGSDGGGRTVIDGEDEMSLLPVYGVLLVLVGVGVFFGRRWV